MFIFSHNLSEQIFSSECKQRITKSLAYTTDRNQVSTHTDLRTKHRTGKYTFDILEVNDPIQNRN